jgi:hypothetical protein
MKLNYFLTLTILTTTGILSNGQSVMGLTVGYNKSIFFDKSKTPHYSGQYTSHPTYCITAFLKLRNHKKVNVGSEISFVPKVLDLEASYGGLGGQTVRDNHFNLNYVYASIFPELSIGENIVLNLSFGPAFGFLISSHVSGSSYSYDIIGNYSSWTNEGSARSDFYGYDLRLFANIGLELPIKNKFKIAINNSYSRGMSNTANGGLGSYAEMINSNDRTLTLGIIYRLDNFSLSPLPKPQERENSDQK